MGVKKVNDSSLSLVADEIRAKGGTSEELTFPQGFVQGIRNLPEPGTVDTEMSDTSENAVQNKVIKAYVDSEVEGKQDALVADGTYYVDAEVDGVVIKLATKAYVDSKDPFMLMDFNQTLDLSLPYCTENIANTSIPNVDVVISDELGAEWAIASLAKYEVKNANSQRVNCWPVCSFSMNGQKTLRIRMMCAGTSRQTVASINGAILLKRR